VDYGLLAERYDELRPAGERWLEVADWTLEALAGATRLLDVGCGTGRFTLLAAERLGCRAWGVDASPAMLAQARERPGAASVGWRQARAEQLPFRDGWFDAVHASLVLHAVAEPDAVLREMARVCAPGGRLAVLSFDLEHFRSFYLNPYFPSLAAIDLERFIDPDRLAQQADAAGFAGARVERLAQSFELDPPTLLERVRGRFISTLHLLAEDEYRAGLEQLEREVAGGRPPIRATLRWALVTGRRG
jgi:ubiquinone/menaquinone biosynthesis C-methylase UbiE